MEVTTTGKNEEWLEERRRNKQMHTVVRADGNGATESDLGEAREGATDAFGAELSGQRDRWVQRSWVEHPLLAQLREKGPCRLLLSLMRKGGANDLWEPHFVGSYNHNEDLSFILRVVGTRKTVKS